MGWARANILYEKMNGPPEPGTPLESLLLLVWRMRQNIEVNRAYVMVNSIIASSSTPTPEIDKKLQESWTAYTESMYPFNVGRRKTQDDIAIEYLKQQVAKGPLVVVPLEPLTDRKLSKRKKT